MADKKDVEKQKDSKQEKQEKTDEKASGGGILQWIIMAVVIILFSGSGFALARLLAGSDTPETAESSSQEQSEMDELTADNDSAKDSQKTWYYDLEPVVANLDVPGVTRYVRASLTMEVSAVVEKDKGIAFFEKKNPILKNWLTIYLASLTLEDIRGDRNLKRIQSQILDAFNEKLFPDAKPQIKKILFKEFAIQ